MGSLQKPLGLVLLTLSSTLFAEPPTDGNRCHLLLNTFILASVANVPRTADEMKKAIACLDKGHVIDGARIPEREKWKELFAKHAEELGIKSPQEYETKALALAKSSDRETFFFVGRRTEGKFKFNPTSNEMIVINKDGLIQTYFKPNPLRHKYLTNLEYFLSQYTRY